MSSCNADLGFRFSDTIFLKFNAPKGRQNVMFSATMTEEVGPMDRGLFYCSEKKFQ